MPSRTLKCLLTSLLALLASTFILFASLPVEAQTFRGGIRGRVEDASGALLSAAEVKIVNASTQQSYSTQTTTAGEFSLLDLPLGSYSLTVKHAGFEALTVSNIEVRAGSVYPLELKLAVNSVAEKVNVTASAVALETVASSEADVLLPQTVQNVPLNGRDFTQLLTLTPGYSGYGVGFMSAINGAQASQTNWQIEGADNNDLWINTSAVNQGGVYGIPGVLLPLDSVEEFSVLTQGGAESSRNPGGTVNLVLRSGSNQVHGSAYYYNRNEFFAAEPVFGTMDSSGNAVVNKNKLRNQQAGFSVGGPIFKNRTFYFASYERQDFDIGNPTVVTEPSAAYQTAALDVLNNPGQKYGSYAPVAANPVSLKLLADLWPSSALAGPAAPGNYSNPGTETGFSNNAIAKLDHSFSQAERISLRAFIAQGHQTAPTSSFLSPYFESSPMHVQNWALVQNSTLSARATNQLLLGINYFGQTEADANTTFNPLALGLNTGVSNSQLAGAPRINIGSDSQGNALFDPIGINPYSGRRDLSWHLTDTFSYAVGRHELRFGAEFRHAKIHEFYHNNQRGSFTFSGQQGPWGSSTNVDPYLQGLADFLAGEVATSSIVQGDPTRHIFSSGVSFFAQDHFQVTSRLNFNYGLRYDFNQPIHNNDQNLSVFDPTHGLEVAGGAISSLYPSNRKNFAPNVGFALRPFRASNTAIRGSFGISFDTVNASAFLDDSNIFNGGPYGAQYNPAGKDQVQTVTTGGYTLPTDGSNVFAQSNSGSNIYNLFSVSQHYKTPRLYNYSLNVQQALGKAAVAQVGYVGSLGRHLLLLNDINQQPLGSEFLLNPGDPSNLYRPYYAKFPQFGVINELDSSGTSNYNSLQATLKTNSWHGVTSQFAYTWAHTLDYGSFLVLPQDSTNRKGEYGNSDFDQRNNFTAYFVYDLPAFARGPKRLTQGWKLSSVLSLRSGLPFTVNNYLDVSGTGENADRLSLIANPYAGISHSVSKHQPLYWVNANSFAANWGQYGTMRRNQLNGPGFSDVDLSVSKETAVNERVHAQLRADVFNLFNRVNLGSPTFTGANGIVAIPGVGNFGIPISYTNGSQFGLPGIGPGEPFNVQLALKVIF
jgi:hypothetical protein